MSTGAGATHPLADLLASISAGVPQPSASQARLIERLDVLRVRLLSERLQLAVLGQFKRGKSTLLNALLGSPALPTGILPLTAIPTVLRQGKHPTAHLRFTDGRTEDVPVSDAAAIRALLEGLVTETANPKNMLGLSRVEIGLPSPLLARGVVLIDTPGVGSTFRHNTQTAEMILPECDAALFVVSPDPPITEVEIGYLGQILPAIGRLIVILNKTDTIEPEDREVATAFLAKVLGEQAGVGPSTSIFCLSARDALRASQTGDPELLASSGLPRLEAYLTELLTREKQAILTLAVAQKAAALVGELRLECNIVLQALGMPRDALVQRIATFDEAAADIEGELQVARDLLAGERNRMIDELLAAAERLRGVARATIEAEVDRVMLGGGTDDAAGAAMASALSAFFEAQVGPFAASTRESVGERLASHQRRANDLIGLVRKTAAELMAIPYEAPESAEAFEIRSEPYWVTSGRTETLNPLPPDLLDRFMPGAVRKARSRKRLLAELDAAVGRNVENLRWATRQNLEDAFRRFGAALDEQLRASLAATRDAMAAALQRRELEGERIGPELHLRRESASSLAAIDNALQPFFRSADAADPCRP